MLMHSPDVTALGFPKIGCWNQIAGLQTQFLQTNSNKLPSPLRPHGKKKKTQGVFLEDKEPSVHYRLEATILHSPHSSLP